MAKAKNNLATEGFSGRLGGMVYRQKNGNTIISRRPKRVTSVSPAQDNVRKLFKQAAVYAKAILANPLMKQFYSEKAKEGTSAYNTAMADFFNLPEVVDIDAANYNGSIGSKVSVAAFDDGKITSVRVRIEGSNGMLLEEGMAVQSEDGLHWIFTTGMVNSSLAGSRILATAMDIPGHTASKQIVL